jgi:hypothetical protein
MDCNNGLNLQRQSSHSLKERILSSPWSSFFSSPRNAFRVLALGLLIAGTYGHIENERARAPAAAGTLYDVAMTFTTASGQAQPRVQVRADQSFKVALEHELGTLSAAFALTAAGADAVRLDGTFGCGAASGSPPTVTARLGEPITLEALAHAGTPVCELVFVVTRLADAVTHR